MTSWLSEHSRRSYLLVAMILGLPGAGAFAQCVEQQKLTASDADDRFGRSVSVSGETVVVGAFGDNCPAGSNCGSAYVFSCRPPGIPTASNWGLVGLTLLLLAAGTIVFARKGIRAHSA